MRPFSAWMSARSTSAPATETPTPAEAVGTRCTRSRDPSSDFTVAPGRSALEGTFPGAMCRRMSTSRSSLLASSVAFERPSASSVAANATSLGANSVQLLPRASRSAS